VSLYIPSFAELSEVAASRGGESDAPELWRGLVGWWPMQEGAGETAFDFSGYGRHGVLTNMEPATDHVVGPKGRALYTDGSNEYIAIPSFELGWPMTALAHVKFADAGSTIEGVIGSTDVNDTIFVLQNDTHMYFYLSAGTKGSIAAPAPKQEWCQVGTVWGNDLKHRAVINGVVTGTHYSAWGGAWSHTVECIGTAGYAWNQQYGHQKQNNVALWNRQLTAAELLLHYTDPWAMGRMRRRTYPVAPVAGVAVTGAVGGNGASVAATAGVAVDASGVVGGSKAAAAIGGAVPVDAEGAPGGSLATVAGAAGVVVDASGAATGAGTEAAAAGSVAVDGSAAAVGAGSEVAIDAAPLEPISGGIAAVGSGAAAAGGASVRVSGAVRAEGAPTVAELVAACLAAASVRVGGDLAVVAASVGRAAIEGPFRVERGDVWHPGAVAGDVWHPGAVAGKVR